MKKLSRFSQFCERSKKTWGREKPPMPYSLCTFSAIICPRFATADYDMMTDIMTDVCFQVNVHQILDEQEERSLSLHVGQLLQVYKPTPQQIKFTSLSYTKKTPTEKFIHHAGNKCLGRILMGNQ
jgi:hypothetical protein